MVCDFCYITKEEVEATELWVMISYLAIYIGIIFLITHIYKYYQLIHIIVEVLI